VQISSIAARFDKLILREVALELLTDTVKARNLNKAKL
jgi:hypothetical protein